MIRKLLEHFKELDDTHRFYDMDFVSLYVDKHHNYFKDEPYYFSISLYVEDGNKVYTTYYDYKTLKPVSIENPYTFDPKIICDFKEEEREEFERAEIMIEQFIQTYNPEKQIEKMNGEINRHKNTIENYENAIAKIQLDIDEYSKGLMF